MNESQICVSVHADTAEEMIRLLREAEPLADVVELRFDTLDQENTRLAFEQLSSEKQVLLTMRPKNQGGHSPANLIERNGFWTGFALFKDIDHRSIWLDHEHDLIPQKEFMFWLDQCFVIRSRHYLEGEIPDLNKAYETVVSNSEVGKIAVTAKEATDAIGVWKLLLKAKDEGMRLIPIAMGEGGKWTRVLGPAHGAFMTYASLNTGSETAPGQISAADLAEVFRVKELDVETGVYGVIAGNTSYSVSPWMHNAAFKAEGLNSVFVPLQVSDLDAFIKRMVLEDSREIDLNFKGFSVTNPHKQTIMEYVDVVDETALKIGAVNTVKIQDGKLYGYNTDAHGFISTLKQAYGELSGARAAVFGAGGAARACVYSLTAEGASVTVFARNEERGSAISKDFSVAYERNAGERNMADDFDIVVNTTPLGTTGSNANFAVLTAPRLEGVKFVYDLVYNPAETRLLREAKAAGVPAIGGLEMLIAQGAMQFEIWTGKPAPLVEMRAAVERHLGL